MYICGTIIRQEKNDCLGMSREAKYQLESMEQPMLNDIPGLAGMPALAEVLRACTIPRRDRRIASCMQLMHMLKLKAEQYGIVI